MDPVTAIGAAVAWAWPAMASGVAGNAAYDALKALLGVRYQAYAEQGKEELFKEVLSSMLEQNQALLDELTALAAKHPQPVNHNTHSISGNINIGGSINAGGNVTIGHNNNSN